MSQPKINYNLVIIIALVVVALVGGAYFIFSGASNEYQAEQPGGNEQLPLEKTVIDPKAKQAAPVLDEFRRHEFSTSSSIYKFSAEIPAKLAGPQSQPPLIF